MKNERLMGKSLAHSLIGYCAIKMDGEIITCNDAFNQISACTVAQNQNIGNIIKLDQEDIQLYLKEIAENRVFSKEISFDSRETPYYALANATVIDAEGEDDEFIAIFFTGVNQQKVTEIELEERISQEIAKNQETERMMFQQSKLATMGEMIENIAHQWRQPLNMLALVFQDLYIKFQLNSLSHDLMEANYNKANNLLQYMSQTIDDFRTFFKSEEKDELFDVQAALMSVFELVGTRFTSHKTKCEVEVVSNGSVIGTQNGFKQVVINLLNNAQEAIISNKTLKGHIDIEVHTKGVWIIIEVSDNGGGIPKDIIEQVFDPYFTTKHKTRGTGLGLYMSKQIIEHNMKGKLEVRNGKEGAIFSIALPLETKN